MTCLFLLIIAIGEACVSIKGFRESGFRQDIFPMVYTMGTPFIYIFCAAFLFKGANWARIFFYGVCLPLILLGPLVFIRIFVFGLCSWRLAAWPANFFFTRKNTRPERPLKPRTNGEVPPSSRHDKYDY